MNRLKNLFLAIVIFPSLSFAAPAGLSLVNTKAITEDMVKFRYYTNDGTFDLSCTHVYDKPEAWDWDVWCGKGTKWLRQFRVHFLVRYYESRDKRSAYEVLYWVIDRDQPISKAFSSTTTWIEFKNPSSLDRMKFSQGVENDYAFLEIELKP